MRPPGTIIGTACRASSNRARALMSMAQSQWRAVSSMAGRSTPEAALETTMSRRGTVTRSSVISASRLASSARLARSTRQRPPAASMAAMVSRAWVRWRT